MKNNGTVSFWGFAIIRVRGIHASLGALGWGAGCVGVVSVSVSVPGGWFVCGLEESLRMLKKSGRPRSYAQKERAGKYLCSENGSPPGRISTYA